MVFFEIVPCFHVHFPATERHGAQALGGRPARLGGRGPQLSTGIGCLPGPGSADRELVIPGTGEIS